jgi:hypothetical protein
MECCFSEIVRHPDAVFERLPDKDVGVFTDPEEGNLSMENLKGELFRSLLSPEFACVAAPDPGQSHPHSHAPKPLPQRIRAPCLPAANCP